MKRIFSGDSPGSTPSTLNSNSGRFASSSSAQPSADFNVSPELSPIVTLMAAHTHRRYFEGIFMLLNDLTADGKPGDRKWEEVYGVLTGTQLAVWDANKLSKYRDNPEKLITHSSKPTYINFTDSSFKLVDKLPSANGDLTNVIVVSTTLKNRYLLQYASKENFQKWNAAFRLATFEYTSLQEAYTGLLLSARGSRLSDIRVILAETKYEHEDWVSVRFGSGMPWKRCYLVIEPSPKKSKKKFHPGKLVFYENEKKNKKTAMASITLLTCCYAIYPQTPELIDHSTLLKLEGTILFHKNDTKNLSVFLMPEQHFSVPGFDTIIRFLIPTLDAFGLYGRPKKLNADKTDPQSLLFGLPVLPRVHYLELDDVVPLASLPSSNAMSVEQWISGIKAVLQRKLSTGYTGCGSSKGIDGAIKLISPTSMSDEYSRPSTMRQLSPLTPSFLPVAGFENNSNSGPTNSSRSSLASSAGANTDDRDRNSNSNLLTEIYNKYSQLEAPTNRRLENNLSDLSLGSGRSKLSDDDLPERSAHGAGAKNIFDPTFGDAGFDNPGYNLGKSSESLNFQPVPLVAVTASSPVVEVSSNGRHLPPQREFTQDQQRVLSPYSEFHQQVNHAIGVPKPKLAPLPKTPNYDNPSKLLPTPPADQGAISVPRTRNGPGAGQLRLFDQRAPNHNIVAQRPQQAGLQQAPIRNLTPTNTSYGSLLQSNPYAAQQPQYLPQQPAYSNPPRASPLQETFGMAGNPYLPASSGLPQQGAPQGHPQGPRPMQQRPQQPQQRPQQHQQYRQQHPGQYPPQQQQQQYPPQQHQQQQYPPQQYPPQQYPQQKQLPYPQQSQLPYPQQSQLPYPQQLPSQQRLRKAPPPHQAQNPAYPTTNPYSASNQYI